MKFPHVLADLLPKKEEAKDYFFSLYLDIDAAAVATWHVDTEGIPKVTSFAHAVIAEDTWESRMQVVDRLLSAAEDKVGVAKAISKTVFGMPGAYLTAEGNILDAIRPHLKKLTTMLELTPVGFVPLPQAIAFSFKKDEGVPASMILLGCSGKRALVSLFRVGNLTHEDHLDIDDDPAAALEASLKKHQDGDVLPSRILLYGGNSAILEEVRSKLLKHPWPTRTNFLHFPKIELITVEALLTSISLAGASELSQEIGEGAASEADAVVSTVVAQPGSSRDMNAEEQVSAADESDEEPQVSEAEPEDEGDDETESAEDEAPDEEEEEDGVVEDGEAAAEDEPRTEELSNVEVVSPESLGFSREDVLERQKPPVSSPVRPVKAGSKLPISFPVNIRMPSFPPGGLDTIKNIVTKFPKLRGGALPFIIGAVILIITAAGLYYVLPKATVTVLVSSQSVDESTTVSVDASATVADPATKIIPGKVQEQSVSGEKTIAVTGKKNVGDPAKGTVTIYNKVTTGKTFPKGTVLSTGGVAFTLDSDVSVASASESIGSITFGKANANVTARDIGPNGNVTASSEFTFANINSTQVSARNESAFTGGTSKQVTVVSRADQDALVKALTSDLVAQAKQQLLTVASGERLIDATVKTDVSEKVFDAELDQEARELHGKVTVKVSGISISDGDIKAALSKLVEAKVPAGFTLAPEQTTVSVSNVTVKKDGTITLTAKLVAVALPQIDEAALKQSLAGRDVQSALSILKETKGVSGAEFRFFLSPTKSRLPLKRDNITVTVMVP